MTKKRFSIVKLIATLAMAMVLSLSLAMPVFASGEPIATGTESAPAEAAITKILKMPIGTPTPNATFDFTFTKVSVNGNTTELDDMPDIGTVSENISAGTVIESGGVKTVWKETNSIFAGKTWPHAGIFIYSVEEDEDTYTLINGPGGIPDKMTYSEAVYEVAVYVKEKENNPGEYYVFAIAARITESDESNKGGQATKVDPTPGGGPEVTDPFSQMIFTNYYLKNNGGTNPGDTVLAVSKEVTGSFGDKTRYFEFSVQVTKPDTVVDEPGSPSVYSAYIMEKNGSGAAVVVTNIDRNIVDIPAANIKTQAPHGRYIEFVTGQALKVYLRHDQWLSFNNLPVGSGFNVSEAAAVGYTPDLYLTAVGASGAKIPGTISTGLGTNAQYIGNFKSSADFVNDAEDLTPTGLAVSNLPFVIMIAVAIAAIAAYVAIKYRKRYEN